MRKIKKWTGIAFLVFSVAVTPITVFAGWEPAGGTYRYRNEDGAYAVSQWINENGTYYYLDEAGYMARSTTTPDGYLVDAGGAWVTETQVIGTYVRTPYDNQPYYYDPEWRVFIFDESTDYTSVTDTLVLSAVRGITPVSQLSEKNRAVYDEVCKFLVGFDYGASDYEKAKKVYEEITGRAVYHEGKYTQADDEVYSILVTGTGKCVGFARTYKLLANAVGLKSGLREDGAHMWNSVYVNGEAKAIDASTIGTSAAFYLEMTKYICPTCGYENTFGARESARPCRNCGTQIYNPKYN